MELFRGSESMARKHRPQKAPSHYDKIASLPGFVSLINYAREMLSDPPQSVRQLNNAEEMWMKHNFMTAVWTIVDLFKLPSEDQVFVENSILFGVDRASKGTAEPRIRILIPELDRSVGMSLAAIYARHVIPMDRKSWLGVTRNDKSSGVRSLGVPPSDDEAVARATVIRGSGVPALMMRNGTRIYLDVTDASKEDIERVIPLVNQLRRSLQLQNPTLKTGAPSSRDEARAVEAALLHQEGDSYVEIGRKFGWPIYVGDVTNGTCPTAVKYVKLGRDILEKIQALDHELEESIVIDRT
jgi:hypothetical protein